jgi:D-alanyl-D-alanine carboxypeptidase
MLKNILLFIGATVLLLVVAVSVFAYLLAPNENTVLDFVKNNKDRAALLLYRNDTLIAKQNPDKIMPLASTVKIIIAIEYAVQASNKDINPDDAIPLSELDNYYVPNTDGDAHPTWLKAVKGKIKNNTITIREIAKGMIEYSSNANTEWLLDKLTLKKVNARLDTLQLKKHTKIYPIVSALFVGKEVFSEKSQDDKVKSLKALTEAEYINYTDVIHQKLKTDTTYKKQVGDLNMAIQRIWSDRLPSSTVAEYVSVMKKINSRAYFDSASQTYLDEVMEYILENPKNRQWLAHSGMKGGSTAFVLTKALYATDKKGNKTELAYFFNDLTRFETLKLQMSMNEFELKILTDNIFVETIKTMN